MQTVCLVLNQTKKKKVCVIRNNSMSCTTLRDSEIGWIFCFLKRRRKRERERERERENNNTKRQHKSNWIDAIWWLQIICHHHCLRHIAINKSRERERERENPFHCSWTVFWNTDKQITKKINNNFIFKIYIKIYISHTRI